MGVMVAVSLLTPAPAIEKTRGIIWNRQYAMLPAEEQRRYRVWKDFRIWLLLFVSIILSIYGFFIWFRLRHPW